MPPILTSSHDEQRVTALLYRITNKLFINPEVWISELNDHKGLLTVTWSVNPTQRLKNEIDKIWELDFNEVETQHIYQHN